MLFWELDNEVEQFHNSAATTAWYGGPSQPGELNTLAQQARSADLNHLVGTGVANSGPGGCVSWIKVANVPALQFWGLHLYGDPHLATQTCTLNGTSAALQAHASQATTVPIIVDEFGVDRYFCSPGAVGWWLQWLPPISGVVSLSVSGLPSGASGSFSPATITGSGSSTLTVSTGTAAAGSYPLTITGTSGSLSHTAGVTLVVTAAPTPDFSIAVSPSSRSVVQGGSTTYTVTVTPSGGFAGTVALSVSGLPSGSSASFSPASLTSGNSTLTVTTTTSAAAGTYPLTITGTSGSLSHSASTSLTITRPDFGIGASPGSQTALQGTSTTYTVSITPTGGFTGTVSLSVRGLPGGTTGSFSPASLTSGNSTLTVAVGAATAPGTYTLTIAGTSGSLSHSVTVTLVVTAPSSCVDPDGEC